MHAQARKTRLAMRTSCSEYGHKLPQDAGDEAWQLGEVGDHARQVVDERASLRLAVRLLEPHVLGRLGLRVGESRDPLVHTVAGQQELRQLLIEDGSEPITWVGALQTSAPLTECVNLLRDLLRVHFAHRARIRLLAT